MQKCNLYVFFFMVLFLVISDAKRSPRCLQDPPKSELTGCRLGHSFGIHAYYKEEDRCLDKLMPRCNLVLTENAFNISEGGYVKCIEECQPGRERDRCLDPPPTNGSPTCLMVPRYVAWYNSEKGRCEDRTFDCPKTITYNSFLTIKECEEFCKI